MDLSIDNHKSELLVRILNIFTSFAFFPVVTFVHLAFKQATLLGPHVVILIVVDSTILFIRAIVAVVKIDSALNLLLRIWLHKSTITGLLRRYVIAELLRLFQDWH